MQWPDGWEQITPSERQALEAELKREVAPGYLLYRVGVTALGRRNDCDDVLFSLNSSASVAVVHLSYTKADALWPQTQIFSNLNEWQEEQSL